MEEDAIGIGLDLDYFWGLNPHQFNKHIKVFNRKEENRIKEIDRMNHELGQYIYFAFNDPKNYPKQPFMSASEPSGPTVMSDDEMEQAAIRIAKKMGGEIK